MKTKKIINYKNLPKELKRLFLSQYGTDFENSITEFKDPRDNKLHKAVTLETDDFYYLVIIDKKKVKRRNESKNIAEDPFYGFDDNEESEGMSFYFA